jgi:signal transduction histidine kinase
MERVLDRLAQVPVGALVGALDRTVLVSDRGIVTARPPPPARQARLICRPVALKRAFANLIDNAVKYGGGARVSLDADAAAVTVRVEDDGPGIPEEALETVFEPFRRLEDSRNRGSGGSGLGLTIARQVVEAHGGTLVLANRAGGGLAATVRLRRRSIAGEAGPC